MKLLSAISPLTNWRQLKRDKEAATLERLTTSHHVADLRLIFSCTVVIMATAIVLAMLFSYMHESLANPKASWDVLVFATLVDCGGFIGVVGAVGCGVLAWTYQTGSARLGVVDLFACEIATLCRVTVVADTVQHFIALNRAVPEDTMRFTSTEQYFPVFDATTKDLQQLEEKVVKNVTEFYTYMKVARDYMRKLADVGANAPDALAKWQAAIGNIMYMLFLALESARKSMQDLVEFQPRQAEDTITILLSELTAYAHLRTVFIDDLRCRRLEAREEGYLRVVPGLLAEVTAGSGPEWAKAKELSIELGRRYEQVFPIARDADIGCEGSSPEKHHEQPNMPQLELVDEAA
jgi:hypothetical protein